MIEIVSIILNGLLGSGLIVTLVTLKSKKQKAATEAERDQIDLVASSVRSMIESQKALMSHNQDLIEALTIARRENSELSGKIDMLEKKINSMLSTNKLIVKLLRKLNLDDDTLIKLLDSK